MSEPLVITSDDPILKKLNFKQYRNIVVRRAEAFSPLPEEPQTKEVKTPWGSVLMVTKGDMLISDIDSPGDQWPVDARIFDESYIIVGPGLCIKRAVTLLVPLVDATGGDENQMVTVHTLEGAETVRAGDFFLALGVQGEIWPTPKEKVVTKMRPID